MHRRLLLFTFLIILCSTVSAQQNFKIKVLENKSRIALPGIRVQNLNTKQSTVSDTEGRFSINAKLNDLLVLTGFAYQNDTLLVTTLKLKEILMEPKGEMLKEVKVTDNEVDLNLPTGGTPDFHNQTMVYQRDANGFFKGGIAARIWSAKGGEKKRKADAYKAYVESARLEIDKVFDPKNLAKYLPLKPEELLGFKMNYIPSVPVYSSASFNLLVYVDSCYKEYKKLPPEKRVIQPLVN